jgi:SOS-response transcriptional repressor LexA
MSALTTREYEFIVAHIERTGFQPSVREMAAELHLSPAAVVQVLKALEEKEQVGASNRPRALRLHGVRFIRLGRPPVTP